MSYDLRRPESIEIGAGTAKDISATGVFAQTLNLMEPAQVNRLYVKVTVAVVSSAPAVITFRRRPTYGSASGQTALGTISVPGGTAANAVFYNDITPVLCNAGDQIVADCTTAATSSGSVIGSAIAIYSPEVAANMGFTKVTV